MSLYTTVQQLLFNEGYDDISPFINDENVEEIKVDNWNGGIYDINIKVPIKLFSSWKKRGVLEDRAGQVLEAFRDATSENGYDSYRAVNIHPSVDAKGELNINILAEEPTFWQRGYYRMFISHLSENKSIACDLKRVLGTLGISCFVAHEDIEPTKVWQDEILRALATTNVLCAIVSPGLVNSEWCDQEVGFALGRDILCVPLMYGEKPYGILGMSQGVQCKGVDIKKVAVSIFNILCTNSKTKESYTRCVVDLFLQSTDTEKAMTWLKVIDHFINPEKSLFDYIRNHFNENTLLSDLTVRKDLNVILKKQGLSPIITATREVDTDDLPF